MNKTNRLIFTLLFPLLYACSQPDTMVRKRLEKLDTTLTFDEIMSQTVAFQEAADYNPSQLDKMAKKMYKLNETGKYREALQTGKKILTISPNNITALKECSFAYSRLNVEDSAKLYFNMMVRCIEAVKSSAKGDYDSPYSLNNSFELTSIIEATYGLYPDASVVIKDSKDRIILFQKAGRIAVCFAQLDHWSGYLKKGEYVEGDFPSAFEMETNWEKALEKSLKELRNEK